MNYQQLEFPFMIVVTAWDGQRTFTHLLAEDAFIAAVERDRRLLNEMRREVFLLTLRQDECKIS